MKNCLIICVILAVLICLNAQDTDLIGRTFYRYSAADSLISDTTDTVLKDESYGLISENIRKKGVIYRGVRINADSGAGVISGLNLELEGNLSDSIQIEAYLSDEQLAVSEEGSTEALTDIEKVYIQFKHPNFLTRMGDFKAQYRSGDFGNLEKELSGAYLLLKKNKTTVSGYISAESSVNETFSAKGSEGISGPYVIISLSGIREELVAGSETVYLNGKKLSRGEEYYIDYQSSELFFRHGYHIKGDDVITVDYQYISSDYKKNVYGFDAETRFISNTMGIKAGFFREEEDRDKPLKYDLNDSIRAAMKSGDKDHIYISGAVYSPGKGNYDLGADSVHFNYTGNGNGDYLVRFTYFETGGEYTISYDSLGTVYFIYDPLNGGNYLPLIKIEAPGSYARFHSLANYSDQNIRAEAEVVLSAKNNNMFYSDNIEFTGSGDREKIIFDTDETDLGKFELHAQRKSYNRDLILPLRKEEVSKDNEIDHENYSGQNGLTEYSAGVKHYFRSNTINGYDFRSADYGGKTTDEMHSISTLGDFAPFFYTGLIALSKLRNDSIEISKKYGDISAGYKTEDLRSVVFFKDVIKEAGSDSALTGTDKKDLAAELGIMHSEKADLTLRSELQTVHSIEGEIKNEFLRRYTNSVQMKSRISSLLNSEIFWSRSDNQFRSPDSSDTEYNQLNFKVNYNKNDAYRIYAEYETERSIFVPKIRSYYKVQEGTGSYVFEDGEYFPDDFGDYEYYVSLSEGRKELNGVKFDVKSYFDFKDKEKNDNIFYFLTRTDLEQDLSIVEKTTAGNIYDIMFLNIGEFQTDSTVSGTIESRTGLYFMKKSRDSFEYHYNYRKNCFSEYMNFSDNSLLKEQILSYKNISGKFTNSIRMLYSDQERFRYTSVKTDDISKKYVSCGIRYNFSTGSYCSGEFEYGNENEGVRDVSSDSYRVSAGFYALFNSKLIIRSGLDGVNVISKSRLPYSMNSGYGKGWSYKWNISSDYNYSSSIKANLIYAGRYLSSDPKPFHELKAEIIMNL